MRNMVRVNEVKISVATLVIIALSVLVGGVGAASERTFTPIDVPGATSTVAHDINAEGDIVGTYTETGNKQHGFLLSDGVFTTIDFPGSTLTHALGVSSRGDIVGEYQVVANIFHGFLLRDGVFTSIDFPGARSTTAWGVSAKRAITGNYTDASSKIHAFLLNKHGEFATLDPPFSFVQAQTHGVNSNGTTVGCWWDSAGMMHSLFVRDGEYITNDFPDATMSMNWRVNSEGWMAGHYADAAGTVHGYQSKGPRRYTSIDYPGATLTEAHGINDSKEIVGRYRDANNKIHGFLLSTN